MRRTRILLALAPMTAACRPDAEAPGGLEPTIWLEPSATIDPTALPLHDQAYVVDGPARAAIYACDPRMFQQVGGPGATTVGGWVDVAGGTFDVTQKPFVQGNVFHEGATFTTALEGERRTIAGNGLPLGVPTGLFPVDPSDPVYAYDRNPNEVTPQAIAFAIPARPTSADAPACIYKEVGITLDGIALHGPLDSIGRDELAYQVQDACSGAPQPGGGYHRHALSECTPHIHERNALVGYALDGFGLYSPYTDDGVELTSADLDECHGLTSEVPWEGQHVTMYHYVLTRDFPYTVACFRGTPTRNAFPPLPGAPPQS